MEEKNINDILGAEDEYVDEEVGTVFELVKERVNAITAERVFRSVGTFVLWAGLIVSFILLFALGCQKEYGDYEFSFTGVVTAVGVGVSSVLTWAGLRIVANISTKLSEISDSLKKEDQT